MSSAACAEQWPQPAGTEEPAILYAHANVSAACHQLEPGGTQEHSSLSLGNLPWTNLLRFFSVREVPTLRLVSKTVCTAVSGNVEAISLSGSEAARAFASAALHTRLPHVRCITYSPVGEHGAELDCSPLLDVLTAMAQQQPGRVMSLKVTCALSASTRQAQRTNLPPSTLTALFTLPIHWTALEVPLNPTAATPAATSHAAPTQLLQPQPAAAAVVAAAAASAAGTGEPLGMGDGVLGLGGGSNTEQVPLSQLNGSVTDLLPETLNRLTLKLTRQLSDASCLSRLSGTLTTLKLTNYTGSSGAHAQALGQLQQLTSLQLVWAHSFAAREAASGHVRATRAAAEQLEACGVPEGSAGFWRVLGGRLGRLTHLSLQGNAAQIALLECVVHMQQVESLMVHLEHEQSYVTLLLACIACLPRLTHLHLHNLHLLPSFCSSRRGTSSAHTDPAHLPHHHDAQVWQLLRCVAGQETPHEDSYKSVLELLDCVCLHDPPGIQNVLSRAFSGDATNGPRWFGCLTHLSLNDCRCVESVLRLCLGARQAGAMHRAERTHAPMQTTPSPCAGATDVAMQAPAPMQAAGRMGASDGYPQPMHREATSPCTTPPLAHLRVTFPGPNQRAWLALLPHFECLQSLALRPAPELDDGVWRGWHQAGLTGRLKALSLCGVGEGLSSGTLRQLGGSCPRLRVLRVSRVSQMGESELGAVCHGGGAQASMLRLVQVGQQWAESHLEIQSFMSHYTTPPDHTSYSHSHTQAGDHDRNDTHMGGEAAHLSEQMSDGPHGHTVPATSDGPGHTGRASSERMDVEHVTCVCRPVVELYDDSLASGWAEERGCLWEWWQNAHPAVLSLPPASLYD